MSSQNPFLQNPFEQLTTETNSATDQLLAGQKTARAEQAKMQEVEAVDQTATEAPAAPATRNIGMKTGGTDDLLPPPELMKAFESTAQKYDIPANVIMAIAHQESRYNPQAVGQPTKWGTAKGMMQNLDSTAKGLGIDPHNAEQAIDAAAKQIRERLDKGASMIDAIKEHFAGPDRKLWGEKTDAYGREVMDKVGKIGDAIMAGGAPEADGDPVPKDWVKLTPEQAAEIEAKQANHFSTAMPRDQYQQTFLANNPRATPEALAQVMAQYDQKAAARTAQNPAQDKFREMSTPGAAFDRRLNEKLQGPRNGVVPNLPGKMAKDTVETPAPAEGGILTDIGKDLKIGLNTAAQDVRELVSRAPGGKAIVRGGDAIDNYFHPEFANSDELLKADTKEMLKDQSPEQRAAAEKKWWDSDKGRLGSAWSDWRSYSSGITQSLPEMVLTMGPAGRLASAVYKARAAIIGAEAAAKVAARTAMVSGALSEGALGGAASAREVRDQINALPQDVLDQSDAYKSLIASGMQPGEAKTALAEDMATRAFVTSGVVTTAFGGMGDRALAKIFTSQMSKAGVKKMLASAGKGAVAEGLFEELPQSVGQQLAQNEAVKEVDPSQSLSENVINQGLGGAVLGGIMGGGMGGGAHLAGSGQAAPEVAPAPQVEPTPVPVPVPAAPARPSGPLTAAVEGAAAPAAPRATVTAPDGQQVAGTVQGYQEDEQGNFAAQIEGDDGQVHTVTSADGVVVTPEAAPAGPLTSAVESASEAHAENPAAPPVAPEPAPAAPTGPDYASMDLPQLRDRLKYIAGQAKSSGGWNKMFMNARKEVEKQIRQRETDAMEASKLSEEPTSNGPFDDRAVANKMALRIAEKTGAPQEVVEKDGKFTLQPYAEVQDGNDDNSGDGRGRGDRPADPTGQADGAGQPGNGPVSVEPVAGDAGVPGEPVAANPVHAAGLAVEDAPLTKEEDEHAGKWFSSEQKADEYIAKRKIGKTHRVEQTGRVRYEVKPRKSESKGDAMAKAAERQAKIDAQVAKANENAAARAAAKVTAAPAVEAIDQAAHEAATSPMNDLPQPTDAQKEAGNYKKGHVTVAGLDVTIENPRGSKRTGKRPDGTTWSHTMSDHYGYIKRTTGADNEQVDVYVGPKPDAKQVFVVDQLDQQSGGFDEHKIMLGFPTKAKAMAAYKSNFDKGWKLGPVKAMSTEEFKTWLKDGDTTAPAAATSPDAVPESVLPEVGQETPKKKAQSKGKAALAERARQLADYFTPGNIVKGYGGHDRVLSYTPTEDGRFSVTVQGVVQKDGEWVVAEGADGRERTHATMPDASKLKAGPVERAPATEKVPELAPEPAPAEKPAQAKKKEPDAEEPSYSIAADKSALSGVKEFREILTKKYKGLRLDLFDRGNGDLNLSLIVVPKDDRSGGTGTKVMQEIIDYADATGKRLVLTTSADFGGNKARLNKFYKRFGFVDNKGRSKDFTIMDGMYREPLTGKHVMFSTADGSNAGTEADIRAALADSDIGALIAPLIESGKVRIHATAATVPFKLPAGVQAIAERGNGRIHLIADALNAKNAKAVLLHEMFHAGGRGLMSGAAWNGLMNDLAKLHMQGQRTGGRANQFWKAAAARVADARKQGDPMKGAMIAEEFGAYTIEHYAQAPAAFKKWVDDLVGTVKAWVLRTFGKQAGKVTPAQLMSLAKAALADAATVGQTDSGMQPAYSMGEGRTIEVDGKRRPITNSKGQLVGQDFAAQTAFWKWFGDSHMVDQDGRPLVLYHGTSLDFSAFKPSKNGMYGAGIYMTKEESYANAAAMDSENNEANGRKNADAAPHIMPLYASIQKPFYASKNPVPDMLMKDWHADLKKDGYDGIVALDQIIAFEPEQVKSVAGNDGTFDPENSDIRYSIASSTADAMDEADDAVPPGLTPPEQGMWRNLQSQVQDNMNRLKQVQERIMEVTGRTSLGNSDYYGAETNRPGRIAARLEDAKNFLFEPLMKRLAKSGHTIDQLNELLHAMHAQERNERVAAINDEMPDGGSGMTTAKANEILEQYKGSRALHALADQARDITKATLDMKLAYGLIKQEDYDSLSAAYKNYVPLKGDGEFGPKIKRAMGHEERDELILDNIARDYDQAVVVGEKNLARQTLLQMVLQFKDDNLWTARVPPRGRYVAGQVFNVVKNGETVGSFTSQAQVSAFLEAKGADAANHTVLASNGDKVTEFVKPLQDNEVMVYIKGDPVRIQIKDEKLASQLRPLDGQKLHWILEKMRAVNRYLSKIYTGYNPAFILRNAARDAMTGTINMMGNQGAVTAAKAWANYPKSVAAMAYWAATKKAPSGVMGQHLSDYRQHGGKVGASYMGDLEEQGKTLQRMYDDAYGASGYLADGKAGKAAWIAGRKIVGGMAHVVEIANQATENALRLALYTTLREQGRSPGVAAQAAKGVTVDFDRKGTSTAVLGAIYLFFNPAVQGTANGMKTLFKGEHKEQAWAALAGLAALGFYAATKGMDDDRDRWLGEGWEPRTKNLMMNMGEHQLRVPLSQEFAPFYAFGAALGEASRGENKMTSAARVASSFIDAYFPLQGAYKTDSDNHALDAGMSLLPTTIKPEMEAALNRNAFGSQIVPESEFTKDRPDNLKMTRGTKNSPYDKAAQKIAEVGEMAGAGRYENDMSKVSPETLKHYWRTYTGGLGTFIGDAAGLASMAAEDTGQVNTSDVPIVKDFVRTNDVKPIRGRFYELAKEARRAQIEFKQAKKLGDGEAMDKISADETKVKMASLANMMQKTTKAAAQLRDEAVDVNADRTLTGPQKREQLKNIEQQEEALYRSAIESFKE